MTEPDPLLTINEACAYLGGIHRATLYREIRAGRLSVTRMVVGTRIARSELERYLLAQRREGPGEPELPNRWTLYRFLDRDGALLYVGITGQGAARWSHHSRYQPWWTEVATIRVEHHPSLEAAAAAEAIAIRDESPRFNVKGKPR